MSLLGFGVKNLRCLTDTGVVPIKPLTLLVGRNSSGKSTFLRAFPLLRQSVEAPRASPILWYDPALVDFGSFTDAVSYRSKGEGISFRFRSRLESGIWIADPVIFDVTLTLSQGPEGPYVASYEILVEDHTVVVECALDRTVRRYEVNSYDMLPRDTPVVLGGRVILLPTLQPASVSRTTYIPASRQPSWEDDDYWQGGVPGLHELSDEAIHGAVGNVAKGRVFDFENVPLGSCASMLAHIRRGLEAAGLGPVGASLSLDDPALRKALALRVACTIPAMLEELDRDIAAFFSGVTYVAPRRASASRAYRIQDVSVEDVAPQGENLAMFLRSLSPEELASFAGFTRTHLGFEVDVRSERLHAEILIKERGADRFVNLVDAGFGFAELLPLAAILWSACVRARTPGTTGATMVAIEQPELHLHPSRQATLPRMLVGALDESRKVGRDVKLLVETHSDAVVNQLGMLIRAGKIACEDVQILFFDQDPVTRETKVVVTGYERDGALQESWPFGFLVGVPDPLDDVPDAAEE